MADLVVFLTALGMAIVAWLIQRALFGKMKQRGARFDEQRALDRKKVSRPNEASDTSERLKDPSFIAQPDRQI
jgi:hypothetical protein